MEEALRARLLAIGGLTAIVGNRIDWDERPQGDPLPGMVLYLISDIPEMKLTGPTGWRDARVQCDGWSYDVLEARNIGEALIGGVIGLRETLAGIKFRIFVIDVSRKTDLLGGQPVHASQVDLKVIYQV